MFVLLTAQTSTRASQCDFWENVYFLIWLIVHSPWNSFYVNELLKGIKGINETIFAQKYI